MFLSPLYRLIALSEDLMFSFETLHIKIWIYKGRLLLSFTTTPPTPPLDISENSLNWFTFPVRRKILSILDSIDFSQDIPEPLQLDFFDRVQIEQVIANCEHKNARGQVVCNVKVRSSLCSQVACAILYLDNNDQCINNTLKLRFT